MKAIHNPVSHSPLARFPGSALNLPDRNIVLTPFPMSRAQDLAAAVFVSAEKKDIKA
jgi:hypothetical protein